MLNRRCMLAAVPFVLLAGCASTDHAYYFKSDDPAVAKLQAVADDIHANLGMIATIEQSNAVDPKIYKPPTSGPLATPVSMVYTGPVEQACRTIAGLIGYTFHTVGSPPLNPLIVKLHASGQPAFMALDDIGWQTGTIASVVVNSEVKEIQLVYVGNH